MGDRILAVDGMDATDDNIYALLCADDVPGAKFFPGHGSACIFLVPEHEYFAHSFKTGSTVTVTVQKFEDVKAHKKNPNHKSMPRYLTFCSWLPVFTHDSHPPSPSPRPRAHWRPGEFGHTYALLGVCARMPEYICICVLMFTGSSPFAAKNDRQQSETRSNARPSMCGGKRQSVETLAPAITSVSAFCMRCPAIRINAAIPLHRFDDDVHYCTVLPGKLSSIRKGNVGFACT